MADLPNRDEWEARLARDLGRLSRAHLGKLLEYMGDPPNLSNVPAEFWEEAGEELRQAIRPTLRAIYEQTARDFVTSQPIGIDLALVNERALSWAQRYTFDLVRGINDTRRNVLQQAVSSFFDEQMTLRELSDSLSTTFGPVRAEMIAVTETTRASVQGELETAEQIAGQHAGLRKVTVWQTSNDERVCPVCGPRHGKEIADGNYPPAHPRCRCWVNTEVRAVEAA